MTDSASYDQKRQANSNSWYLLATLYGCPSLEDDLAAADLRKRNRAAWNRYMAGALTEGGRAKLMGQGKFDPEELTPFSEDEAEIIRNLYIARCPAGEPPRRLPNPIHEINFTNIRFEKPFIAGGYIFPIAANFGGSTFAAPVNFTGSTFLSWARFTNANFASWVNFLDAAFARWADFSNVIFSRETSFDRAIFNGRTHFTQASFVYLPSFSRATFSDVADFRTSKFSDTAHFERANFAARADFEGASFSALASFHGASFSNVANFMITKFSHSVNFECVLFSDWSLFENSVFDGPTTFEAAIFAFAPPFFFGAKLHEGTVWRRVGWPRPRKADQAGQFVDAYERLKLEMDRLKKHENELEFFALELQSRRILDGFFHGTLITIYGVLSNFGRSYVRPLIGITIVIAAGAVGLLPHFGCSRYPQALGLSLANTFAVFGFRKDFIDPEVIKSLSRALTIVSALQTVAGTVLLFLVGLALRNRFRIR
jgi:hypothetical protein